MNFTDISIHEVAAHLLRLAIAFFLSLPIAWNRERRSRSAGLRTFPLVAVGSCAYMILGLQVLDTTDAESRVIYGIITGIGFIGGGAILKVRRTALGTATAAAIWSTGAIGVAVAFDRVEVAIALTLLTMLTFWLGSKLKDLDEDA